MYFSQVMFSPFYIHILLTMSCFIFSCSLFHFIIHIQIYHQLHQLTDSTVFNNNHDFESKFSSFKITISNLLNASDERTNKKAIREKVFSSNKTYQSILDRFVFVNPPNPACIYSNNTENVMIIIVLSRATNFDFRQAIRATWGRNGKYKNYDTDVRTLFFVGVDDMVHLAVRNEQTLFNDVIEIGRLIFKNTNV